MVQMDYTNLRQQIPFVQWSSQLPDVCAELGELMRHSGSMTKRLKQLSRSHQLSCSKPLDNIEPLTVHLVGETLSNQAYWEREVLLQVNGKACIWAQSQIPFRLREQPLANQPLGEWLFAKYQVTRTQVDYASIRCEALTLSVRRSCLVPTGFRSVNGDTAFDAKQTVVVIECFLPCISDLLRENSH
jgi:chorismate-pyruvate lyase